MLSSSTLDDLIRKQENLRLQSIRNLEELRSRQDRYRSCRFSERHLPNQCNVSLSGGPANASLGEHVVHSSARITEDGNERRYRRVSTVSKSSSLQGFSSAPPSSDGFTSLRVLQHSADDQKHINARQSRSVLSDDLNSEKWSTSATQAARMKLMSGRTLTNLNNSSSVDIHNGSRVLEPATCTSGTFTDLNGCRALEFDTNTVGYFSPADEKLSCSLTPQKSEQSLEGTPKSVLRHRQIIDKNVHVESKFDHTPANVRSRKQRRALNFSYSDVDDAELFGRKTKSVNFDVDSKKSTVELNAEDTITSSQPAMSHLGSLKPSSFVGSTLPASQRFYYAPDVSNSMETSVDASGSCVARPVVSDGLLLQTGNDRQNAKIVRELESRSQLGLFSTDQPLATSASTNASQSQVLCNYIPVHCFSFCIWSKL